VTTESTLTVKPGAISNPGRTEFCARASALIQAKKSKKAIILFIFQNQN